MIGHLLFSQSMINRLRVPVHFKIQSGTGYDSNFLKLSNSELDEISFYPSLLGDSESSSSLILKHSFSLKYNPYLVNNYETRLAFKMINSNYISSNDKTYSSFSFYLSQNLGNYEWLKWSYSFMPKYYLRDYRDRDDIIIKADTDAILHHCYFSQGSTTLSYSKWFLVKRTWIEGILNYKTQYYNPDFTEFNLNISSISMKISSNYYKKYSAKVNFTQSFAENTTYQNGLKSTEDINRGYEQQYISIMIDGKKIPLIIVQNLGIQYSIAFRNYSSDIESDLLHHNRSHTEEKINCWFAGKLHGSVDYRVDCSHRYRNAVSDIIWVEDLKDFNKMEYYFTLSYEFSTDMLY